MQHTPVLLNEVLTFLEAQKGKKIIDATIGGGGHTKPLLEKGAEVLGIDRDNQVVKALRDELGSDKQFQVVWGSFSELKHLSVQNGFDQVDGILFDFGLSSVQLDNPERGFSFQKTGPLDMRFDQEQELDAQVVINKYPEQRLVEIFKTYGEEKRFAKRIAKGVAVQRRQGRIKNTTELFKLIKKSLPSEFRSKTASVARKIFQSIRIEVNQELEQIKKALPQALEILRPGGRLVAISFHSLEDRIVKEFFRHEAKGCVCPPEVPVCRCNKKSTLKVLTKKVVEASIEETKINPRAKSAKLRAAEKK